jgi:hypothetical protein
MLWLQPQLRCCCRQVWATEGMAWRCDTDVTGGQHRLSTKMIIKREKKGGGDTYSVFSDLGGDLSAASSRLRSWAVFL